MNLEQRVRRLENQNRTLWRIVLCCAVLVIVCISIGADQVANQLVLGTLTVQEKVTTPAIELTSQEGAQLLTRDDLTALSRVKMDTAHGNDPTTDQVITTSSEFSDIPNLEIPVQCDRDTTALVFFSSGEMELPTGQLVTFSLGYERSFSGRTEFVELHRHVLDENYGSYGADFVWVGTLPAQAVTIKMRWRVATGRPTTIGVENGKRRELVLVEFLPGGQSVTPEQKRESRP